MFRRASGFAFLGTLALVLGGCLSALADDGDPTRGATQGALRIVNDDGSLVECPLKHTDVKAEISGFIARVTVTQRFVNPTEEAIEATYVFPLPHEAAVDAMTMTVGDRRIVGRIQRRDEARRIYEQAVMAGRTAALLEQERPNIFTQSVGNIAPGEEVLIRISYVDVLKYDMGEYEFYFPMVVGPRFIPGSAAGSTPPLTNELQGKAQPPTAATNRVPDADRINPPVLNSGMRTGHDISLRVNLDSGVPVRDMKVASHDAEMDRQNDRLASIQLSPADSIPNKDFVLRYRVAGKKPELALLGHTRPNMPDAKRLGDGYFMLMLQPGENMEVSRTPPREMVFLIDVSGSMRGAKTDKTREIIQQMLGLCRAEDTVQVITFASRATTLFDKPLPVNEDSIQRALRFTDATRGAGGTQMLEGVKQAIDAPLDPRRMRIVVMLTDGFIGNEAEIIEHVGGKCGDRTRFWTVGIGESPNMFLIDGVARQGGGLGKRLGLQDESETLASEMMTRIQRAQLSKIRIEWGDLDVLETYPARLPDLWSGRPVILLGRYRGGGAQRVQVEGLVEGEKVSWPLDVTLPEVEPNHDVLANVWARRKIEDLMQQSYYRGGAAVEEEVAALALQYHLMSQYTSFVAVDETELADQPRVWPRKMLTPVPLPSGAEWEGFFGPSAEPLARKGGVANRRLTTLSLGKSVFREKESLRSLNYRAQVDYASRFRVVPPMELAFSFNEGKLPATRRLFRSPRFKQLRGASLAQHSTPLGAAYFVDELSAVNESLLEKTEEASPAEDQNPTWESLLRMYMLDRAAANAGASSGAIADQVAPMLENLRQKRIKSWTATQPALNSVLDMVLRDQSLEDSLGQIAKTAGLPVRIVVGSLGDSRALTGAEPRVTYLNLQGATIAEALDAVVWPAKLEWRLDDGALVIESLRRGDRNSGWVYDVAPLIALTTKEQRNPDDALIASLRALALKLIGAVQQAANAERESGDVSWFGEGQLLVFSDAAGHARVATLIQQLADASASLDGAAADLHPQTAARAAEFAAASEKPRDVLSARRWAERLDRFSWRLLFGAVDGKVDDEALTELTILWRGKTVAGFLNDETHGIALRSLWMVRRAERTIPEEQSLRRLANLALTSCEGPLEESVARFDASSRDASATVALLHAAMAAPVDASWRSDAIQRLENIPDANEFRELAGALLGDSIPTSRIEELTAKAGSSEDLFVLLAIACCQDGPESWNTFRAHASDVLLRQRPVRGEVVVLLSRLSPTKR